MAIFGLVLIGMGGYVLVELIEINRERELKDLVFISHLQDEDDESKRKLLIAISNAKERERKKKEGGATDLVDDSLSKKREFDFEMAKLETEKKVRLMKRDSERNLISYSYYQQLYIVYKAAAIASAVIGLLLMMSGFMFWYYKYQRFIDRQMYTQLDDSYQDPKSEHSVK